MAQEQIVGMSRKVMEVMKKLHPSHHKRRVCPERKGKRRLLKLSLTLPLRKTKNGSDVKEEEVSLLVDNLPALRALGSYKGSPNTSDIIVAYARKR